MLSRVCVGGSFFNDMSDAFYCASMSIFVVLNVTGVLVFIEYGVATPHAEDDGDGFVVGGVDGDVLWFAE